MDKKDTHEEKDLIVKPGEIFWCYLGINIGSEQNGSGIHKTRPVLIMNKFSESFFLVGPLTSKKHIGDWYVKISFNDSCLILNQVRPVDIKRLGVSVGHVSEEELRMIIKKYIDLIKHKKH